MYVLPTFSFGIPICSLYIYAKPPHHDRPFGDFGQLPGDPSGYLASYRNDGYDWIAVLAVFVLLNKVFLEHFRNMCFDV